MHPIISGGKLRLSRAGFLMASTAAALVVGGAGGGGSGGGTPGANAYVGGGTGGSTLPAYQFARQTQRTGTNTYVVPASIPLVLKANGASIAAGTVMNSGAVFAQGHLPDTSHLTLTQAGTTVQVQQDAESYWPDGSVRFARLTWRQPAILPADTAVTCQVTPTAGAPDRTALITPAALVAAKDVTMRATLANAAPYTYETSVREIVTNLPQETYVGAAPSNPIGGWSVVASGPFEVMIRAWRFRHDKAQALTTGYHGYVHDVVYLSYRADGTYEWFGRGHASNWSGPLNNGAVGTMPQGNAMASAIEAFDGSTRIGAWGGPNDPRVTTVAASTFNTSTNTTTLHTIVGVGNAVALSGSGLPSGLVAGTPYYPDNNGKLWPGRYWATGQADGQNNFKVLGTAGSGTVTVTPMAYTGSGTGELYFASDALPIRIGGTRVETSVAWSMDYLCKGAKAFPCYDTSYTPPASTPYSAVYSAYATGLNPWGYWLNASGDNPGDIRIGLLAHWECLSFMNPLDAGFAKQSRVTAAGWSAYAFWWKDERSGQLMALGNGPDDAGGQWPGLGSNIMGRNFLTTPGNPDACQGNNAGFFSGYNIDPGVEASHMPCPWIVAALQTGCFAFIDQGIPQSLSVAMWPGTGNGFTINGQTYHYPVGQEQPGRGVGWHMNIARFAEMMTATARPEAALQRHIWDRTWQYYTQKLLAAPTAQVTVGGLTPISNTTEMRPEDSGYGDATGFYMDLIAMQAMLQVRDGIRPLVRPWLEVFANLCVGVANDLGSTKGTGWVSSGAYHPSIRNADGSWRTIQQLMDSGPYSAGSRPYSATGLKVYGTDNPWTNSTGWNAFITTDYATIKLACLGMLKEIGIVSTTGDDAHDVHDFHRTRLNTAPCRGVQWSTNSSSSELQGAHSFPVWSQVAAA